MNGSPESLALLTVGSRGRWWCRRRRGGISGRRAVGIGNLEQPPRRDRRGQGDVGRDSIEERARGKDRVGGACWPDARRPRRVDVGVPHSRVARVGRAVVAICSGVVGGRGRGQVGRAHDRVVDVGVAERMERPLGEKAEEQRGRDAVPGCWACRSIRNWANAAFIPLKAPPAPPFGWLTGSLVTTPGCDPPKPQIGTEYAAAPLASDPVTTRGMSVLKAGS